MSSALSSSDNPESHSNLLSPNPANFPFNCTLRDLSFFVKIDSTSCACHLFLLPDRAPSSPFFAAGFFDQRLGPFPEKETAPLFSVRFLLV